MSLKISVKTKTEKRAFICSVRISQKRIFLCAQHLEETEITEIHSVEVSFYLLDENEDYFEKTDYISISDGTEYDDSDYVATFTTDIYSDDKVIIKAKHFEGTDNIGPGVSFYIENLTDEDMGIWCNSLIYDGEDQFGEGTDVEGNKKICIVCEYFDPQPGEEMTVNFTLGLEEETIETGDITFTIE